jgi:RimJ/RimL family protein N-acetyltransferase
LPDDRHHLETPRLRLRCWRVLDRGPFAALHADPDVMHDLGGPISRSESDQKLDRYIAAYEQHGFGRWAVESHQGMFLGYVGVMHREGEHPLGSHDEIGWRLNRSAWGEGYATEAAAAALSDVFSRVGLTEVLAYTTAQNHRSSSVMSRLGMRRDPSRDFLIQDARDRAWRGLVWVALPPSRKPHPNDHGSSDHCPRQQRSEM